MCFCVKYFIKCILTKGSYTSFSLKKKNHTFGENVFFIFDPNFARTMMSRWVLVQSMVLMGYTVVSTGIIEICNSLELVKSNNVSYCIF